MIRIVNGIKVTLTAEEETAVLADQEANKLPIKLYELVDEANRRIELIAPTRDRDKLMARTMHLMRKEIAGTITVNEEIELSGYDSVQQMAESIRIAEATIKAEVEAAADPSLIDITNHAEWP